MERRASFRTAVLAATLAVGLATGCGALKRCGYSPADRDEWQQPDRVLWTLGLEPGQDVADLGAGGGYFTFRLARAVGGDGTVYAVDVDEDMTSYLEEEAAEQGLSNVRVVLAEPDDAGLPPESVDLVLTVNTFHHLSDRAAYFRRLAPALRPGGRIAVIELSGTSWFEHWGDHYTDSETIVADLTGAGFSLVAEHDFLERQHFLVFGREEEGGPASGGVVEE